MVPDAADRSDARAARDDEAVSVDEDATLRRLVGGIVEAFDPEQVILFGSRARGDATPRSDYDLCVVASDVDSRHDMIREIHGLREPRTGPMDIFVLTPEEYDAQRQVVNTLGFYVDRDGVVLHERS